MGGARTHGDGTRSDAEGPGGGIDPARRDPRPRAAVSERSAASPDVDDDRDIFGDAGLGCVDDDRDLRAREAREDDRQADDEPP